MTLLHEVTKAWDEFWVNYGRNARRLFAENGLQWASEVRSPEVADLIRKGWEAETARLMELN